MLFWIIAIAGCLAFVHSMVFLVLNWENRRYWQRRQNCAAPNPSYFARTRLVIPCKGVDRDLENNISKFLNQDHPNYEVVFAVESWDDPCVNVIRDLIHKYPNTKSCIKVAGRAQNCGQKVQNLRTATENMPQGIEIVAFADIDAKPNDPSWLRWLVRDAGKTGIGGRTGYRWFKPKKKNFATYIVCSINNSIAALLGKGNHLSIWGGSWATHRRVFESVGIRDVWKTTLSDDLAATRAFRSGKLGIKFEPKCVCTTNVKYSTRSMFEFLRRQFLIGRIHDPWYWWTSFALLATTQIGFWGCAILGLAGFESWTPVNLWLVGAVGLYAISVYRGVLRRKMGKTVAEDWSKQNRHFVLFDMFCSPIVNLMTLVAMIISFVGRSISWAGIHYYLGPGGQVTLLGRDVDPKVWVSTDPQQKIANGESSLHPPVKNAAPANKAA